MMEGIARKLLIRLLRGWLILLWLTLLVLPILFWYSQVSLDNLFNDPERWISTESKERRDYEWFLEKFGTTDLILISWEGCTIDDPRLSRLESAFSHSNAVEKGLVDRVITGKSLLDRLTAPPLNLSPSMAIARLQGIAIGEDGKSSCGIIVLSEEGIWRPTEAIRYVLEQAKLAAQLPEDKFIIGGPPIEGEAIDRASQQAANDLMVWSTVVSMVIAYIFLRSWRCVAIVIVVGALGQLLSLSLVYWSGYTMNAVLIVMPPLVFVLVTSMGVHLANYYWDAVAEGRSRTAPLVALARGWLPCALALVTTTIGLASLGMGKTVPVRVFGTLAGMSLVISSSILLIVFIGATLRSPLHRVQARGFLTSPGDGLRRFWPSWSSAVTANWVSIVLLSGIAFVAGVWGVTNIKTSVRLPEMFREDSRIISDYRWLEDRIGPLTPVEVVLSFDDSCSLNMIGKLTLVNNVQSELHVVDGLAASMSAATLAPQLPRGWRLGSAIRRTQYDRELAENRQSLREQGYFTEDGEREHWRISTRVWALRPLDYGGLIQDIRQVAEDVVATQLPEIRGIHVTVTGVIPYVYRVQRVLLRDLLVSFATAVALIGVVLAIAMRGIACGAIAMIPNLFPTIVVFGLLGWWGNPLDIGTIMTASVALGIAVDDTVHFITWFRRGISRGMTRIMAIRFAFSHCGSAMVQTSLICGAGLFVYIVSDFVPASRFAWMMAVLLGATLISDLILLPALLASPLGRVFQPRRAHLSANG